MRCTTIVALLSLLPSYASADAVPPEPKDCLPGSVGRTCHGGPYCGAPTTCKSSAECSGGMTCQPVELCAVSLNCAGGWGGGPFYVDSIKGTCTGGTACATGTCKTYQTCLATTPRPDGKVTQADGKTSQADGASTPPAATSRGCSCELAAVPAGSALAIALLLGAVLTARRRRG